MGKWTTTTNISFDPDLPAMTENVRKILIDSLKGRAGNVVIDDSDVLASRRAFDDEGPYCMAKRLGLLVNNSAEDMAIEYMTFVNKLWPQTY